MHIEKHTQIIDAAIRRINRLGTVKTTMEEIARDTHLTKSAIFYYFPSKTELVGAVLKKLVHSLLDALRKQISEDWPLTEAINLHLKTRLDFTTQNHLLFEKIDAFFAIMPPDISDLVKEARQREIRMIYISSVHYNHAAGRKREPSGHIYFVDTALGDSRTQADSHSNPIPCAS